MIAVLTLLACSSPPTKPKTRVHEVTRQVTRIPAPPPAPASVLATEVPDTTGLPDIVLVSIDGLRPDLLDARNSPFIHGLAKTGVRFEHARTPSPWTLPAHTTLFTGQLPTTHYVVEQDLRLPDTVPVLPDLLRARGYVTAGVGDSPFVSTAYGFHRGFVEFHEHPDQPVDTLMSDVAQAPEGRPLFLFLHTDRTHDPAQRPYGYYLKHPLTPEQLAGHRATYTAAIHDIDAQLARLDAALKAAGYPVRWVITSDHGIELGEHGSWGHGWTLDEVQLRIPLIVSGPGIPKGKVVKQPVGLQDLASTLASWAGVADQLRRPDGVDLTPYLDGKTAPPARPFLAETSRDRTMRIGLYEGGERLDWNLADGKRIVTGLDGVARVDDGAWRTRAIELLGTPWITSAAGTIDAGKTGRVVTKHARRSVKVAAGQRFNVFPLDAEVHFRKGRKRGQNGPPMAAAGRLPMAPPLRWEGEDRPVPVDAPAKPVGAQEPH